MVGGKPSINAAGNRWREGPGSFWDRMAVRYPLPFDPKSLADTHTVVSLVKQRGVETEGAKILDIGCGTGTYALPLAREAQQITALDGSPAMVAIMAGEISKHGLTNVQAVQSEWSTIDIREDGYEGAFDIVWTSMSPAVQGREGVGAMERCSRRWCVYIGWGRKRENPLMAAAFKAHGLKYGPPPGASVIGKILKGRGKPFSLDTFETSWEWSGSMDEALEEVSGFIQMTGRPADRNRLLEILPEWEEDGIVRHTTAVEEGILVWEV